MVEKIIQMLKKLKSHILFRIKLFKMDWWFYFWGMNSNRLFPPSFYYTHTEEEIERIKKEEIERLKKILKGTEE